MDKDEDTMDIGQYIVQWRMSGLEPLTLQTMYDVHCPAIECI